MVELEISNAGGIFSKWRLFLSGYFAKGRGQSPICLLSSRVYKPFDKTGSAMNFVFNFRQLVFQNQVFCFKI